ncbi:MAG: PD-(D/E)XK nuclease family protein [Acidobacteriaceae bacterium]
MAPEIAVAIETGGTVIASSARAARFLRRLHGEGQRRRGLEAWQAPDILDWDSWLSRLWQKRLRSGNETRLLLSTLQEQQVWMRLVKPAIEGRRLISVLSVAELAQQAYALLSTYGALAFLRGERAGGADVESFREWARGFEQWCSREDWLSRGRLPLELCEAVRKGEVEAAQSLLFIGFDRITPAQNDLMNALRERGHVAEKIPTEVAADETPRLFKADDQRDEILACAHWTLQELAGAPAGRLPRIAIVAPQISAVRPEIERIFHQVLAPGTVTIRDRDTPLPFEFSLGVPLLQIPMVRAAVLLLRWMNQPILQDDLSWLLLSGFLCQQEEEVLQIASFDARLRQLPMRQREQDLETFLDLLSEAWREAIPLSPLRQRLRVARGLIPAREGLSFADWVRVAENILIKVHWPGPQLRQSEDFQAQARWSRLLDSVAELSFDGRAVSYVDFLEVLERHAGQTIFAPESRDAPVQILGPLEAAGLSFDALWFLGADDTSWPPTARPHPFLTKPLQRKYQMPHADTEQDWKLAKQATERLLKSATHCVFSYPRQNAEGECRPSTLLNFATRPLVISMPQSAPSLPLEDENELAAVVHWPVEREAGGADVLKRQAACPFQSFAVKRLGARPMEETDWGLEARERGIVVHRILQTLWEELKSDAGLLQAREQGRLTDMIAGHVKKELEGYGKHMHARNLSWSRTYLEAEEERIATLLRLWLDSEAKRAPFTFEAAEKKFPATVGHLKLQVRVDRVDAVNGGRVIIDYKTGDVKKTAWEGPRPDEPQLLLYASQVEDLKGLLLARVNVEKTGFVGLVQDSHAVIDQKDLAKPPLTSRMLRDWSEILRNLGEQFLNGEAQVDPNHGKKTCKFCPLPGLCRIAELANLDEDEDGDDGEE